jgi:rod shape determining protein RodA
VINLVTFRSIKDAVKGNDFLLLFFAVLAAVIGMVFIYSATRTMEGSYRFILVQFIAMLMGIAFMYMISKIDYEDMLELWQPISVFCVLFLILVLFVGQGRDSTGTRGWIRLGGIGIQPAEIVKIGFIITMAKHLSHIKDGINYLKNIMLLVLHFLVPVGLILLQPDAGTAMVFAFVFICMV